MIGHTAILSRPSAFLPLAMSLGAVALVVGQLILVGPARQADEGAAAHVWQILMAAQVPLMVYFAITYLPRQPRPAALVLALQALGILAACTPVFLLRW